ncbi:major facilitator superfamily domain-containing protein [Glomus cerebriforme]|uniref:Major facilitator superfamily domain-containing protein n=1 Tax=Glomus cerebriforme TaxID=658196 RepID=A0A397S971_9GLOM|nr:major facilitator superfamily domain-containing protein [Glomus cerebriforme]
MTYNNITEPLALNRDYIEYNKLDEEKIVIQEEIDDGSKKDSTNSISSTSNDDYELQLDDEKSLLEPASPTFIENDPKNWTDLRKRTILIIVSIAGMLSPIANTIFFPAILTVREEMHTTEPLINTVVAIFVYLMGIAPLFWASYSDLRETRRKVYLTASTMFVTSAFLCTFVTNVWWLMILRAIQAIGSSAVLCIGAGTLSDIYIPTELGTAYGLFYLGFFVGPLIGPLIGGYLTQYIHWRAIFWFLTIYGSTLLLVIYFFLPETSRPKQTSKIPLSKAQSEITLTSLPPQKSYNPLAPISLLKYPNLTLVILYKIWVTSTIYVQNILIPERFAITYGLTASQVGLVFLAPGIGLMSGSLIGGKLSDYILSKKMKKSGGDYVPELRLHSAWFGSILIPLAYFSFGWLLENGVYFVYPLITMFLGGFGTLMAFNPTSTYLVESYPTRSASVVALNNFMRALVAGSMSALAAPLSDAVGTGWTFTLMASGNVLTIFFLILVYFYGKKWREKIRKEIPK